MEELLKELDAGVAEAILQRHPSIVDGYEQRIREGQLQQAVTAAGGRSYIAIRALVGELPQDEAAAKAGGNPIPGDYTMEELGKLSPAEYRKYRKGM